MRISFVRATPPPAAQLIAVVDPQARLDDLDPPNNATAAELPPQLDW